MFILQVSAGESWSFNAKFTHTPESSKFIHVVWISDPTHRPDTLPAHVSISCILHVVVDCAHNSAFTWSIHDNHICSSGIQFDVRLAYCFTTQYKSIESYFV